MAIAGKEYDKLTYLAEKWRVALDELLAALPEADRAQAEPALAVPAAILVALSMLPEEALR